MKARGMCTVLQNVTWRDSGSSSIEKNNQGKKSTQMNIENFGSNRIGPNLLKHLGILGGQFYRVIVPVVCPTSSIPVVFSRG